MRVSRGLGIVSENWFFPNADGLEPVNSLGVRFIGDRLAVDAALIFISGSPIPIPWLDFTYHFGS